MREVAAPPLLPARLPWRQEIERFYHSGSAGLLHSEFLQILILEFLQVAATFSRLDRRNCTERRRGTGEGGGRRKDGGKERKGSWRVGG